MNGFYRSKVMIALLIGMPLIALLLFVLTPDLEGLPLGSFTALMISSMAGLLASTTLAVSVINERTQGVYDLLIVRPVRRPHILLAKYLAVVVSVIAAAFLSLLVANIYDWLNNSPIDIGSSLAEPMMVTITMACVSCAVAILVGSLVRSVLLGIILTLYGGNQLSAVIVLTSLQDMMSTEAAAIIGLALAATLVVLAVIMFNRKLNS
ncbi:MAG: ABC-2 family transporter protein [Methanomassiliicoccales archaeon PtaU1.Bin124]|nr:MAG: ABC-2 family transporter protein [Methanomassiliicoccales archaeon PtaU1.Bin124]